MKITFVKTFVLMLLIPLAISCSKEKIENEPNSKGGDEKNLSDESIIFYAGNEVYEFDSENELIKFLNSSKKQYVEVIEHLSKFNLERKKVKDLGLHLLPPEDSKVVNYLASLKQENEKRPAQGVLKDYPGGAALSYTGVSSPKMKKENRNRASRMEFWSAGVVVLCDKIWFGGTKVLVRGFPNDKINLSDRAFDNRTESYY